MHKNSRMGAAGGRSAALPEPAGSRGAAASPPSACPAAGAGRGRAAAGRPAPNSRRPAAFWPAGRLRARSAGDRGEPPARKGRIKAGPAASQCGSRRRAGPCGSGGPGAFPRAPRAGHRPPLAPPLVPQPGRSDLAQAARRAADASADASADATRARHSRRQGLRIMPGGGARMQAGHIRLHRRWPARARGESAGGDRPARCLSRPRPCPRLRRIRAARRTRPRPHPSAAGPVMPE